MMMPGGLNAGKFGKQFEELQKKLARLEEDLRERVVEAAAGGGAVKVRVNGAQEIVDVKIEPEILNPGEKGMLEDLILTAVNDGMKRVRKMRESEKARAAGFALPPGLA